MCDLNSGAFGRVVLALERVTQRQVRTGRSLFVAHRSSAPRHVRGKCALWALHAIRPLIAVVLSAPACWSAVVSPLSDVGGVQPLGHGRRAGSRGCRHAHPRRILHIPPCNVHAHTCPYKWTHVRTHARTIRVYTCACIPSQAGSLPLLPHIHTTKTPGKKRNNAQVAVKFVPRGSAVSKYVEGEVLLLQRFNHPHIVQFHEVFLTPSHLAIAMEFMEVCS